MFLYEMCAFTNTFRRHTCSSGNANTNDVSVGRRSGQWLSPTPHNMTVPDSLGPTTGATRRWWMNEWITVSYWLVRVPRLKCTFHTSEFTIEKCHPPDEHMKAAWVMSSEHVWACALRFMRWADFNDSVSSKWALICGPAAAAHSDQLRPSGDTPLSGFHIKLLRFMETGVLAQTFSLTFVVDTERNCNLKCNQREITAVQMQSDFASSVQALISAETPLIHMFHCPFMWTRCRWSSVLLWRFFKLMRICPPQRSNAFYTTQRRV